MKAAALFAVVALTPMLGLAQEEEAERPFVYGIYYECDVTRQELADEIVGAAFSGVYDAAVEAGEIQSWGWLAHHTGSKWRRLLYHSAPDLGSLMAALETTGEAIEAKNPEMSRALGDICDSHVDYIWRSITGSARGNVAQERGDAGFSVYFVCDMTQEERADEIVNDVLGPVFDQHVGEGMLNGWGWMEHVVGGKYRRIWTMSAADHSTLLATRGAIFTELMESSEESMREFNDICGSHQDMMWDIVFETP